MCEYCTENDSQFTKELLISTDERAYVCDNTLSWIWMNEDNSSRIHTIVINYCPMCGRKLKV